MGILVARLKASASHDNEMAPIGGHSIASCTSLFLRR
jgi:hypothetical protein